jgi:hypothetical protein
MLKKMRTTALLAVVMAGVALGASARAQSVPGVKLPASPVGQAAVQLGGAWEKTPDGGQRYRDGKWLVVDYSRPLLRGRANIFGSGADYGKLVAGDAPVWRAGANDTTRLTTQVPLALGGKTLPPGVYNVFVDLKPGAWTLVLNTQPVQPKYDPNDKVNLYGAYNYNAASDVVRVPMTVRTADASVEQFTIGFVNTTAGSTTLTMAWDTTMAMVELKMAESK